MHPKQQGLFNFKLKQKSLCCRLEIRYRKCPIGIKVIFKITSRNQFTSENLNLHGKFLCTFFKLASGKSRLDIIHKCSIITIRPASQSRAFLASSWTAALFDIISYENKNKYHENSRSSNGKNIYFSHNYQPS